MDQDGSNRPSTERATRPRAQTPPPPVRIHVPTRDMVFFLEKITNSGKSAEEAVEKTALQLPHVRSVSSIILEKLVEECRKINEQYENGGKTPPKVILRLQVVVNGDMYQGTFESSQC